MAKAASLRLLFDLLRGLLRHLSRGLFHRQSGASI